MFSYIIYRVLSACLNLLTSKITEGKKRTEKKRQTETQELLLTAATALDEFS